MMTMMDLIDDQVDNNEDEDDDDIDDNANAIDKNKCKGTCIFWLLLVYT